MKPKGWQKRLTAYLAATRGRVPTDDWGPQEFIEGALSAITGEDVSLGARPATKLGKMFPKVARPMPGDVVIMPDGVIGIWQKTGAYALTEHGWGVSRGIAPKKAFSV